MSWKFTGLRELEIEFAKKLKDIDKATGDGLTLAANHLLEASQPLVPIDTGRLVASGQMTEDGPLIRYVSYEALDPSTGYDYAPIQHEHLWFNHKVGQAKYLEEPFRNEMENMISIIAKEANKGVEK